MSATDTKVAASPTRTTGARRRRARHTAAVGAMGVQYRADCGRWLWPLGGGATIIRSESDLHPWTCKQCADVISDVILGKRRRFGA